MKKLFCLLLALFLAFGCCTVAFAASSGAQEVPHIDMRGFMSCPVYASEEDGGTRLFPPEKNAILAFAKKLLPSVTRFALNNDWQRFGDRLIPAINDLLMPIAYDAQGEAQYGTNVGFIYPTKAEMESETLIHFVYDWRADPFQSAAELNAFVEYVCKTLECEKVALEAHSFGGIVLLTYLAVYGTGKVQSCCFNATAVYGAEFAGELMQGRVQLSVDALTAFLQGLFSQNEYEGLINALISLVDDLGGLEFLCTFVNDLFDHLSDRIWTQAVLPVFGNWPSVWSMVPDEKLEAANDFIFGNLRANDGVDYSGLKQKTTQFNTQIRANRAPLLKGIDATSNLYVIARYGLAGVPLGDIWTANTDGVLNTESESFGATCAAYSYAVPDLLQTPFRSPNGAIDASTCLFPEQTWFIRNCKHVEHDEPLQVFTHTLLMQKEQQTIQSLSEYPQFLLYDRAMRTVRADDNSIQQIASWQEDLRKLIRSLFEQLIAKLRSLMPWQKQAA